MKTILKYVSTVAICIGFLSSCSDMLELNPASSVSGPTVFANEKAAQTAVDGIYHFLYQSAFTSGNVNHAEGHMSTTLAQDLMADDMVITNISNWYGMDYQLYYTKTAGSGQTNTSSRSYNIWNMMYTIIANTNAILAYDGNLGQNGSEAKKVLAQAYALRAFAYFELAQDFQFTIIGNENKPGVPIYTTPTNAGDEGRPRGVIADVYLQINADIKKSIEYFEEIGKPAQDHCSHIDYYVANGLKARIDLVQHKWQDAYDAATKARSRAGISLLASSAILNGMNDKGLASNIWCMEVLTEQAPIYYYYLDYRGTNGGANQRKCISKWLYDKIARYNDDARLGWFKDGKQGNSLTGENVNYGQIKLMAKDIGSLTGDIIFMRAEEMLLIQAEAMAQKGDYATARSILKDLINVRLTSSASKSAYASYLDGLANANTLQTNTTVTNPVNVLEEVILQRRIELWGEQGRIKDLLRLKQGFTRTYEGSNHLYMANDANIGPESGAFIFKIPQREFDGNPNITSDEQNPIN